MLKVTDAPLGKKNVFPKLNVNNINIFSAVIKVKCVVIPTECLSLAFL